MDSVGAVAFHTEARNCLGRAIEFLLVRKCWVPLCLSLLLSLESGKETTCVRDEQWDDLFNMVAKLKEEVERLRRIRECECETGGVTPTQEVF